MSTIAKPMPTIANQIVTGHRCLAPTPGAMGTALPVSAPVIATGPSIVDVEPTGSTTVGATRRDRQGFGYAETFPGRHAWRPPTS